MPPGSLILSYLVPNRTSRIDAQTLLFAIVDIERNIVEPRAIKTRDFAYDGTLNNRLGFLHLSLSAAPRVRKIPHLPLLNNISISRFQYGPDQLSMPDDVPGSVL